MTNFTIPTIPETSIATIATRKGNPTGLNNLQNKSKRLVSAMSGNIQFFLMALDQQRLQQITIRSFEMDLEKYFANSGFLTPAATGILAAQK